MAYKVTAEGFVVDGKLRPKLINAADITPSEIDWLWYPYVPYGAASLLFGPGGTGKSHIAVEIASRLSQGDPLPGQTERGKPQRILMLSAEDDFDKVLVPRLIKSGANLQNIDFPETPFVLDPLGVKALEAYMDYFDASVVFIDPIVHYIGSKVDMNKSNEVRAAIGTFHQIAKANNMAVIIVGHSRKGQEGEDYEKAMGSVDFNNAVRSVLFTTRAPDGTRLMKHVKANYAPLGPAWSYEFGAQGFEWTGTYDDPDGTVGTGGNYYQPRRAKRQSVSEEIKSLLKAGPMTSKDLEQHFLDKGVNARTFQRAKLEAGAESFMVWRAGKPVWYMRLHGDETEIPRVDDAGPDGTGGHTLVRPDDRGALHPVEAGSAEGPDSGVGSGGQVDRSQSPAEIAAAFLARHGAAQ